MSAAEANISAAVLSRHRPKFARQVITPPIGNVEGSYRFMEWVRCGKLSREVFSKKRLASIPVDPDVSEGRRKASN